MKIVSTTKTNSVVVNDKQEAKNLQSMLSKYGIKVHLEENN